jgi:hypothetical protein
MKYDATKRHDLLRLARDIRAVPEGSPEELLFATVLVSSRLMNFANPIIRSAMWIGRIIHRVDRFDQALLMLSKFPKVARETIENTARHALSGKDREDRNSVGGFSQREINLITDMLAAALKGEVQNNA